MREDEVIKSVMRKYFQDMPDWQIRMYLTWFHSIPKRKTRVNHETQGQTCCQVIVDELPFNRPKFESIMMEAIYGESERLAMAAGTKRD